MLIYFVVMAAWPRQAAAPPTPTQIQYALLLDCLSRLLMLVIIVALLMYGTESSLADFGITLVDLKRQIQDGALGFAASLRPSFPSRSC